MIRKKLNHGIESFKKNQVDNLGLEVALGYIRVKII